jgi:CheY-like chemotaxis protein
MSHELRSPLNAILGFAQLMETDSPPATERQKGNIGQILQAGWHLLKLINEILDLAKIESGQVPLSPEPVALSDVLLECRGMIEPQAAQSGVNLTFPSFETPMFVRADRTRLIQVLVNLLSNAVKYNVADGSVVVEYAERTPGRTFVSVRDTGPGLDEEQISQLYQSFNRLGQEAGSVEGTGIGLVVAKQLVELMGGTIGVESTVGEGSVFWFELASAAEPQLWADEGDNSVSSANRTHGEAQEYTLLYVEDNPANMKLVEQILSRDPSIRLLTATDGASGIESARASLPDVVLMDINLPDMSGIEALAMLRSDPATADIPVLAVSANAMPRDIEKGLEAGFFRYVTKPINVDDFTDALDLALQSVQVKFDGELQVSSDEG